jgi:hemerythrin-like domain-containing protein
VAEENITAIERLRRDHQAVLRHLTEFESAVSGLSADPQSRPVPALFELVAFIEHEVWSHFRAEEEALFPLIRDIFPPENAPIVGGPVFVLTEEHGVLRRLAARLKENLEGWQREGPGAREAFFLVAPQLVRAFQKHIYKEDNIVFRLAETFLSPEDKQALETAFARVLAA